jgi:hypothetical protein
MVAGRAVKGLGYRDVDARERDKFVEEPSRELGEIHPNLLHPPPKSS